MPGCLLYCTGSRTMFPDFFSLKKGFLKSGFSQPADSKEYLFQSISIFPNISFNDSHQIFTHLAFTFKIDCGSICFFYFKYSQRFGLYFFFLKITNYKCSNWVFQRNKCYFDLIVSVSFCLQCVAVQIQIPVDILCT